MSNTDCTVHVAVGVVINEKNEVLVAQRQQGQHLAGLWEFPGGKIEAGESCEQALARELKEEVGINLQSSKPLTLINHQYSQKKVALDVRLVNQFAGEAHGREGQPVCWVPLVQLAKMNFPEANQAIITALKKTYRFI